MMLAFDSNYKPPPYSSYKNDKFARHLDKQKKQLQQIKDCSLKQGDKVKLMQEMTAEIQSQIVKIKS